MTPNASPVHATRMVNAVHHQTTADNKDDTEQNRLELKVARLLFSVRETITLVRVMDQPVIKLLQQQPKDALSNMLAMVDKQLVAIDAQRADLQIQRDWIARALGSTPVPLSGLSAGAATSARVTLTVPASDPSAGAKNGSDAPRRMRGSSGRPRRRRSVKRERVKEILALNEAPWSYNDVAEGLDDGSTIESVRVLLRRMAEDGEIVREGEGFKLPSDDSAPNGSAPDDRDASAPTLEGT
jgi:hypothetical protein